MNGNWNGSSASGTRLPIATSDADRRAVLQSLRAIVLERNYISNLLETIAREASGASLSLEP